MEGDRWVNAEGTTVHLELEMGEVVPFTGFHRFRPYLAARYWCGLISTPRHMKMSRGEKKGVKVCERCSRFRRGKRDRRRSR